MAGNKDDRSAARELFAGAISFFKNPPSHHEIQFDDPREVVDMICTANQLLAHFRSALRRVPVLPREGQRSTLWA
jgi:hypothetical protein